MFPRSALLVACVCLLGAVPTGAVYVTTLPTSADVWFDGTYIGQSPVVVDALTTGQHTLSLTRTGWNTQDLNVSVVAGTTSLASIALTRTSAATRGGDGFFTLRGSGVRSVLFDGTVLGPDKLGAYSVPSGIHTLVAQTASGKVTRTVTIYPDMHTDVILRTVEETPHSAVVAPAADYLPPEAFRIDGPRVTIKYAHHQIDAMLGATQYHYDGRTVNYDAAPTMIGTGLYLPLELLKQLTADQKEK